MSESNFLYMYQKNWKKYFIGIFGVLLCMPFSVNANWYTPSTNEGFDDYGGRLRIGEGVQACPEDNFHDSVGPTGYPERLDTDRNLGYHSGGGQVKAVGKIRRKWYSKSQYVVCKQWDSTNPSSGKIEYHNGWTNNQNIVLNISAKDVGGSTRINSDVTIEMQMSSASIFENGRIGDFSVWKNISPRRDSLRVTNQVIATINSQYTYSVGRTEGTAYKFRFRLRDGAGNYITNNSAGGTGWVESPSVYKLDTEPPKVDKIFAYPSNTPKSNNHRNIGDINDDPNNNFYAGENEPITLEYRNSDGSPIKMDYKIEDDNNPRVMNNGKITFEYKQTLPEKFDKVDNDRERTGRNIGGRPISLFIEKIVDEAGNSVTLNKTKKFYVFSNIATAQIACRTSAGALYACNNPLSSSNTDTTNKFPTKSIADGQGNEHSHYLIDKYGNIIIPSPRIGREVKRYINTHYNQMFLNQKTRQGQSSVWINDNNSLRHNIELPIANGPEKIPFNGVIQTSLTGQYGFNISVYTPTASAYSSGDSISDPNASFSYQYWLTIADDEKKIGTSHGKNNPKEAGRARMGGSDPSVLSDTVYLPLFTNQFTGDLEDGGFIEGADQENGLQINKNPNSSVNPSPKRIFVEYTGDDANNFILSKKAPGPIIDLNRGDYKEFFGNFSIGENKFVTFLKQKNNRVENASKIFFSTHFNYMLNGKDVTYNADVIGKKSYFGAEEQNKGNQVGVKIIGNSNDAKFNIILNNQESDIHSVNISPASGAEIRNDIRRSISLATRNMTLQESGSDIRNIKNIPAGSGFKSGIITHDNGESSILVIEGTGDEIVELNVSEIKGKRTIVVRNAHLYIKKDMYYADKNSILGVVVQKGNNGGGNLYIDTNITNVVGSYILDGSVFSKNNGVDVSIGKISELKNQLYIYGSLVSYNTIGGSRSQPIICPNFILNCNEDNAQKYDLNYLRRYYLYRPDGSTNRKPFGNGKIIGGGKIDDNGNAINFARHLQRKFSSTQEDLARYPIVIEYNSSIISNPPIGFDIFRD